MRQSKVRHDVSLSSTLQGGRCPNAPAFMISQTVDSRAPIGDSHARANESERGLFDSFKDVIGYHLF